LKTAAIEMLRRRLQNHTHHHGPAGRCQSPRHSLHSQGRASAGDGSEDLLGPHGAAAQSPLQRQLVAVHCCGAADVRRLPELKRWIASELAISEKYLVLMTPRGTQVKAQYWADQALSHGTIPASDSCRPRSLRLIGNCCRGGQAAHQMAHHSSNSPPFHPHPIPRLCRPAPPCRHTSPISVHAQRGPAQSPPKPKT